MNFDEQRDERARRTRRFTIGGEDFAYRAGVEPEVLADWMDIGVDTPESEAIKIADRTIIAFLENGDVGRWERLRQPGALENPITSGDMLAVLRWLISEQGAGRPTEPSRASSTGSGSPASGTPLTAVSSSQAAEG